MTIAAIRTKYRGVNFRSRLEARWAAFFDLVGWDWEYEPIDLKGWIPDFSLRSKDGEITLLEIKPSGIRWVGHSIDFEKSDKQDVFAYCNGVPIDGDPIYEAMGKIDSLQPKSEDDSGVGDCIILGSSPSNIQFLGKDGAVSIGWHYPGPYGDTWAFDVVLTMNDSQVGAAYCEPWEIQRKNPMVDFIHGYRQSIDTVFANRKIIETLWAAASNQTQWKGE